jgi:hypothetical protein
VDGDFNPDTVTALKKMYAANESSKNFFEWAANRKNDATQTAIDYIAQRAVTDRRGAIEIAQQLDDLECGRFVVGRRGARSRIVWKVSLKSIGKAATGKTQKIERLDPELFAETVDLKDDAAHEVSQNLTIAEAKKRLAASLGVEPEAIEITVRG